MSGKEWALKSLFQSDRGPADTDVRGWLNRVRVAETQRVGRLEIVPLWMEGAPDEPPLVLADQAIGTGWLEVREHSGGVVHEVEARNTGPRPVLILEGETLVGCKQNRVVARSVVVASGASVVVPVGCMERGRWAASGRSFGLGRTRMQPDIRSATVRETARASGAPVRLDQGRLWSQVERTLATTYVTSATSDYQAVVETTGAEAREQAKQVRAVPAQVGMIAVSDGRLLGLELTGHPALWAAIADRTLPSYVLSAGLAAERAAGRPQLAPEHWLTVVRDGSIRVHPALGLGQDVDLMAPGLAGAGLWFERDLAHLAVFEAV